MNKSLVNILIADSSVQITERLSDIITGTNSEAIIFSTTSYETAFTIFKEREPAVVLLGMDLPDNGSIELLKAIQKTQCITRIIILFIHMSDALMKQCQLLGATVFLDKFLEFEKIPGLLEQYESN